MGGANGQVKIKLIENNNTTQLDYEATTKINGKIAQLGSRLINGTVKKNTNIFFNNFNSFFSETNYISNKPLAMNNKEKQEANGKSLINKYPYLYVLLIIFFIVFFVLINYE